jgi:membrane-bound lytic murein transglycosylase B
LAGLTAGRDIGAVGWQIPGEGVDSGNQERKMAFLAKGRLLVAVGAAVIGLLTGAAQAASCGKSAAGFDAWKTEFAQEARAEGVGSRGLSALAGAHYATGTIKADRAIHKAFSGSVESFMKRRGAASIISKGRSLKKSNAALFNKIERDYGVSPGVLLAIWGMETGFGGFLGKEHTLSAVATLAYDCRRSEYFTNQLYAALNLVQNGTLSPQARGAAHGEIGQTQFLPVNVLRYGVDGDGDGRIDLVRSKADALASTANFLRGHGWTAGAGYQPGEANFAAIQGWNAANVYQRAIAIIGAEIDGD